MSEIKFRAIIEEKNTTIYFNLQDIINPAPADNIRNILLPWMRAGGKPDRGLNLADKGGKDIYERDLLGHNKNIYEVKYDIGTARFVLVNIELPTFKQTGAWLKNVRKYISIVGIAEKEIGKHKTCIICKIKMEYAEGLYTCPKCGSVD
ncbi:MAG: hypothetical protein WC976_06680 [Caldisericia bacterium]